ncbi:MAG: hypothetical protein ABH891_06880 [Candidatus Omnitrophota bacterium]
MGKIGIILAFLLSVAAAGGSYYLYQGWVEARTIRGVVEAKYDQVKEKMITVQSEKEKIKAEKEQVAAKSEKYRVQAEAMRTQVGKLQAEQQLADSEKAALASQLEERQRTIAELQTKMGELEQKAAACGVTPADLKTDPFAVAQPFTSASPLTSAVSETGTSQLVFKPVTSGGTMAGTAAMPPSVTPTAQEASPGAQTSSAVNPVATATSLPQLAAAAATTGPKVLTVNRKFNFVVINQGLQEGLKMGDKLKVFQQGQGVAMVQIEKLYDKFSAATLITENPKKQVVEGDEIRRA